MHKKGAVNFKTLGIIGLVLVVLYLLFGGSVNMPSLPQSTTSSCQMGIDVSEAEEAGSWIGEDTDSPKIVLKSTDLNSANITSLDVNLTITRTDSCISLDGTDLEARGIQYKFKPSYKDGFKSKTDSSDSTTYYAFEYSQTEDAHDVTVDGISYAEKKTVTDITGSSEDTAVMVFDVEDYTTLDKLSADTTAMVTLGSVTIVDNIGKQYYNIDVVYLKE